MTGISKAQNVLKQNILDKKVNYNNRIYTRAQFIESILSTGGHTEIKQIPSVKYNRVKYNRMNEREQAAFDKKLAIKKNEYRLYESESSFYELNKTEYNYAKSIEEKE